MPFDLSPSPTSVTMFAIGWTSGWIALWRLRTLPRAANVVRPPVAVVIPARDEAHCIAGLVTSIAKQLRAGDELVVVDDHSSDATGALAEAAGARVIVGPRLPDGWAGKPHACFIGTRATIAPILVFVDADVSPAADILDHLGALLDDRAHGSAMSDGQPAFACPRPADIPRSTLVSVQPWHAVGTRWYEPLSWPFNVVGLMGSARFTIFGSSAGTKAKMAFGPVLACRREAYARTGGHAHPTVRAAVAEDIALAQLFDDVELYSGFAATTFRMYPGGVRSLAQGWTKNMATGAASAQWWTVAMIAAWVCSLVGGWMTSPWFYAASTAQVWVQSRRVGRFSLLTSVMYPVGVAFFVAIFVRSLALRTFRRSVTWKERSVASR